MALVLDIGCGGNKVHGAVGVDRLSLPGVDVVCDFSKDPLPFEDQSVDIIHTRHTLEHMVDLDRLLREFSRVLKPRGQVFVTVPHFTNTLGYSDPTHVRTIGYYTFDYYSRVKDKRNRVPSYTSDIWFRIVRKRHNFRNWSVLGAPLTWLFSRGAFLAYLYESKLSWVVPCSELEFHLEVDRG